MSKALDPIDFSPAPPQDGMMPLDTHAGSVQTTHPGVVELTDIITSLAASSTNSGEAAPAGAVIGRALIPFPTFQWLPAGHSAATSGSIAPETAADRLDDPTNPLTIYTNNPLTEKMYRNSPFAKEGISFNAASFAHSLKNDVIESFIKPGNDSDKLAFLNFYGGPQIASETLLAIKFAIRIEQDIRKGHREAPVPVPVPAPKKSCAIL